MKRIEEEFNCLGYFGFGSGVSMYRSGGPRPGAPAYCNGCYLAQACWQAHRARVKQYWPALAEHVDSLGKQKHGGRLIAEFVQQGGTEPYMNVMLGNMEDGMLIADGQPVKNRGPYSLTYPFEDEQQQRKDS